eukprot:554423_1
MPSPEKPIIKPWIHDYIKTNLSGASNPTCNNYKFVARIESAEWNPNTNHSLQIKMVLSDTRHSIICYFTPRAVEGYAIESFRQWVLLRINHCGVKISKSLDSVFLLIYECCFESTIPIIPQNIGKLKEINTENDVQHCCKIRRKNATILSMNNCMYIKGNNATFFHCINDLDVMYCDVLYHIAAFKKAKGYVTNKEKKEIQNHFLILAENNINCKAHDAEIVNKLQMFYGLQCNMSGYHYKWAMKLSMDYRQTSQQSHGLRMEANKMKFDANDLETIRREQRCIAKAPSTPKHKTRKKRRRGNVRCMDAPRKKRQRLTEKGGSDERASVRHSMNTNNARRKINTAIDDVSSEYS